MAASTVLATRSALKLYLGISDSDTSADSLLDQLLAYASERIESHCERRFAEEEVTEYRDGSGTDRISLRRRPVSALASVHVDADREFPGETEVDSDDIALYPETGMVVRLDAPFPRGQRNVKLVYTAGYSTVPDDLAAACVKLAASWYAHARAGADGIARETLGGYAAQYAAAPLPADVEAMLAPYREGAGV